MTRQVQNNWVVLSPPLPERSPAKQAFRAHAARLSKLLSEECDGENFDEALKRSLRVHTADEHDAALRAALCVLTDLARQRWSIRVNEERGVEVRRPAENQLDPLREKARIRAQELIKRDEQLREPAARRFIKGMEHNSFHNGNLVSIYSVIRDGRELAESLRAARAQKGEDRVRALRDDPMPACRHYLGLYPEGRKSCAQGRDIRGWAIRISGTDFDIVNRVPCVNDVENPLFSCPGLDRKTDEEREAEAQAFRAHANKIIAGLPRIKKLKQMMIERRLYRAKANCPWCTSKDTLRIICNINGNRHISVSCTECGEGFME